MDLFEDPKMASLAKKFLEQSTAQPATKNVRRPYYAQLYGEQVKKVVDLVISTGKPHKIHATHVSLTTVRLQYYEGLRYLKECMDSNYQEKARYIKCQTYRDYIEIVPKRYAMDTLSTLSTDDWKGELQDYLDNAAEQGAKFHKVGIFLSGSDKEWIENLISDIKHLFVYRLEDNEIHFIRYNE